MPHFQTIYIDYIFEDWKAPDVCYRKSQNIGNTQASLWFLNDGIDVKPALLQQFEMLFPKEFVQQVILIELNKIIVGEHAQYSKSLRWLGLWFLMATLVGPRWRNFWTSSPVDEFEGAPFRLNRWMSRTRFEAIVSALRFTDREAPRQKDGFWEIQQMIEAWNEIWQPTFAPVGLLAWMSQWWCG